MKFCQIFPKNLTSFLKHKAFLLPTFFQILFYSKSWKLSMLKISDNISNLSILKKKQKKTRGISGPSTPSPLVPITVLRAKLEIYRSKDAK